MFIAGMKSQQGPKAVFNFDYNWLPWLSGFTPAKWSSPTTFRTELEFSFQGQRITSLVTGAQPLDQSKNKNQSHMTSPLGVRLRPLCWDVSSVTVAPPVFPWLACTRFSDSGDNMKTRKAKIRNALSWERGWSLCPGARLCFSHQFLTSCGLEQANPIANS